MASSWGEALDTFTQDWTINQSIQVFGGKGGLISAVAGTSDRKSTAYQTAGRNVNRWLAAQNPQYGPLREGEKGKQSRNISKEGQARLNELVLDRLAKDKPVRQLTIKGRIVINGYPRDDRTIKIKITFDKLRVIGRAAARGESSANAAFASVYGVKSFEMESGSISVS